MLLLYPPNIDIDVASTQLEFDLDKKVFSSLFYENESKLNMNYEMIHKWNELKSFVSDIEIENLVDNINSTWEEFFNDDFDIYTNYKVNKRIKLKSKVKSISKYNPIIVIE